ncbi:hypothetical protein [Viscerimonas tarda]
MKKILFILTALFVLTTGMSGCDKEEEKKAQIIPCNPETEYIRDIDNFEAVIFREEPNGLVSTPFIALYGSNNLISAVMKEYEYESDMVKYITTYGICNCPLYVKDWEIPEEGLPIVLSGKLYEYNGSRPAVAGPIHIWYILELSTIQKKEL